MFSNLLVSAPARMIALLLVVIAAVQAQENPVLLASKDFLNEVIAQDKHLTMHYVIHNIGNEPATDVILDDSAGFPATEFEVVSGSLEATFSQIVAGSNVSHAVVLKPLISGMHNFVPAKVIYKNPGGDDLITFSSFLDNNPILSTSEYNRKYSPHLVDWMIFVGLCSPVLLIPFLMWHSSHSKYEALAAKAKKS